MYYINLDNMEEDELVFIPPMLMQPFIENSIEHGFSGIDYLGELTLNLSLKEKFIHIIPVNALYEELSMFINSIQNENADV